MRLRTKWTAALLLTGALPLALFAAASLRIQKAGLETSERQLEVAVIDHVATVVARDLDDAAEATHRVGRLLTEASIENDEARLTLAREAMARADLLAEVAIYHPDGKLLDAIGRVGATAPKPPAQVPASAPSPDQKGVWLSPERAGGEVVVRFVEPVFRDKELRAWVLGTLRANGLHDQLRDISKDRFEGRADGVVLLDALGVPIAGQAGGQSTGQTSDSMFGRDLFANAQLPAAPFAKPFALATEFVAEGGEPMVGSARSLPSRGWAIVVRRPASAVYAALAGSRRLLGIAGLSFSAFVLVLGAVLAARTTRPIRALVDLARAFGRHELTRRSEVRTGDELELLGDAMTEMADGIAKAEREILRRASVESNLSRYLPTQIAKAIAAGEQDIKLGGERRTITILFADVVSFTPFAEEARPEQVVAFLNELFTVLTEVVFRHEGVVDKFMGDSMMAIFGAPADQPDHPARALGAAEDMHRFVEASAPAWKEAYGFEVRLAIGLSTGEAVVGNLGSETRMEYTAIGDAVNVAARLEALARPGQTLVTESTLELAGDGWSFAPLGEQPLRGKRAPVRVAEVT